MEWWAARVTPASKLVMGLPAYANDYSALPHWGGDNGTQIYRGGGGAPAVPGEAEEGSVETTWQYFEQIYVHRYTSAATKLARAASPLVRHAAIEREDVL